MIENLAKIIAGIIKNLTLSFAYTAQENKHF